MACWLLLLFVNLGTGWERVEVGGFASFDACRAAGQNAKGQLYESQAVAMCVEQPAAPSATRAKCAIERGPEKWTKGWDVGGLERIWCGCAHGDATPQPGGAWVCLQ